MARWPGRTLGRPVSERSGWAYLRRVGRTPQVPRPAHADAGAAEQAAFPTGCASG